MRKIQIIFWREFSAYFETTLAYTFVAIFAALTNAFTFYVGNFFTRGQADLQVFFQYHPWIYLILVPAIAMRLWAEERKSGSIEMLMTLPITSSHAILGKFLAAWAFITVALTITFPIWLTVNYLGDPDNGVILASYFGSVLMAGAFLAIGSFVSALTKNQVIAFITTSGICFLFIMSSHPLVLEFVRVWAPDFIVSSIESVSFLRHFRQITQGLITLPTLIFYVSLITFFLFANKLVIDQKKAE
ncbi:MAG: ABC transporter permease subunit [Hyphomicrobiaceae bacterium]|nr:ABC transporter permease subunit [Hyphomicrobiaceae bacterium]